MFFVNIGSLSNIQKLNFMSFDSLIMNRLLNVSYNDRSYDIFSGVGDIISLEVLRLESLFKSNLKHVTVHRYIGRVISKYNKGVNSSFYN